MGSVYSIKCPNCNAPLPLYGGRKVRSITCSYCKSVIELEQNYKVVANFKKIKDANQIPFEIGKTGTIDGVEYIIIGRVDYQEVSAELTRWSELLLYNKIYGYAWLVFEDGKIEFSRRYRALPSVTFKELDGLDELEVDNVTYKKFYKYRAKVRYVEGELTYIAKFGDNAAFYEFINPPKSITFEQSENELEGYIGKYLDSDEVYDAFDVPFSDRVYSEEFNALKPFNSPKLKLLKDFSLFFLIVVAVVAFVFNTEGKGKELASNSSLTPGSNAELIFNIDNDKYLSEIILSSKGIYNLQKIHLNLYKIKNNTDVEIFELLRGRGNFKGTNIGRVESYALKIAIFMHLEKGKYKLKIGIPKDASIDSIILKEGVSKLNYLEYLAIILIIFIIIYYIKLLSYKNSLRSNNDFTGNSLLSDATESGSYEWIWWIVFLAIMILDEMFGD